VQLAPGYELTPEGSTELILAISDVCARQGQRRVLVEGTVAARKMGTMDSFGLGSLGQVLIKLTAPGVPDFYQGTELWDLSLVDPDNRRPVNFEQRDRMLRQLDETGDVDWGDLLREWRDGRIKLAITARALRTRRADGELFGTGDYVPLAASEERADDVVAFGRRAGERDGLRRHERRGRARRAGRRMVGRWHLSPTGMKRANSL
jgi:maltooligosyltrehalose synthase